MVTLQANVTQKPGTVKEETDLCDDKLIKNF